MQVIFNHLKLEGKLDLVELLGAILHYQVLLSVALFYPEKLATRTTPTTTNTSPHHSPVLPRFKLNQKDGMNAKIEEEGEMMGDGGSCGSLQPESHGIVERGEDGRNDAWVTMKHPREVAQWILDYYFNDSSRCQVCMSLIVEQ